MAEVGVQRLGEHLLQRSREAPEGNLFSPVEGRTHAVCVFPTMKQLEQDQPFIVSELHGQVVGAAHAGLLPQAPAHAGSATIVLWWIPARCSR